MLSVPRNSVDGTLGEIGRHSHSMLRADVKAVTVSALTIRIQNRIFSRQRGL